MKACGLIVEYNPLHNGHIYHIEAAKKAAKADCIIAIMSGSFLQRGEPAIIDKFHRTRAALAAGVDIVIELPFMFAAQSSELFARGAVLSLAEMDVSAICFGSESGSISHFITSYDNLKGKEVEYQRALKTFLNAGLSYPRANENALRECQILLPEFDLSQPNNILGFSYVKTILANHLSIEPLTIKRIQNDYHQTKISSPIASATSIRNELFKESVSKATIDQTYPVATKEQLAAYHKAAGRWHQLADYFPLLHYRVQISSAAELAKIHGVDEGLEFRLKDTAKSALNMEHWLSLLKTKRYTWTRLQRTLIHILTNTKKAAVQAVNEPIPYIRVLGFTNTGQEYLAKVKKNIKVPLYQRINRNPRGIMAMEERASLAYYSILPPAERIMLMKQELTGPIMIT